MSYKFIGEHASTANVAAVAKDVEYKTQVAANELLSLSYFMKKSLLYIAVIVSLSLYTSIVCKKNRK